MTVLSIVTTCKDRLDHLHQTIPLMCSQKGGIDYNVIVVDYGCSQGAYDWCKSVTGNYPNLVPMKVLDDTRYFNNPRARNCGAMVTPARCLCFLDADAMIQPGYLLVVADSVIRGKAALAWSEIRGTQSLSHIVVKRQAWKDTRGYDEAMVDWGFDDTDFFRRIAGNYRIKPVEAKHLIELLPHSNELRVANFKEKSMKQSWRRHKNHASTRKGINPSGFGRCKYLLFQNGQEKEAEGGMK